MQADTMDNEFKMTVKVTVFQGRQSVGNGPSSVTLCSTLFGPSSLPSLFLTVSRPLGCSVLHQMTLLAVGPHAKGGHVVTHE